MSWAEIGQIVQAVATLLAAVGVGLAYRELRLTQRQSVTEFEDGLASEYREIARRIPVAVLLGSDVDDDRFDEILNEVYNYIDLSNEQVFLRQLGRVRKDTFEDWRAGMKTNLERPAFRRAWEHIKQRSERSFEELRRLEESGLTDDPKAWGRVPTKG